MKTNEDAALLGEIKTAAEMARRTLPYLIRQTDDEHLKSEMNRILGEYEGISGEVERVAQGLSADISDIPGLSALGGLKTESMVRMSTLLDGSDAHIADLTLNGGAMGVKTIAEAINRYPNASAEVKGLAEQVRSLSDESIRVMQPFLDHVR